MSYPLVEAGELMARRNGSLDPSKFPDEEFELHSIPAYDAGRPDLQLGRNIGSAKQLVEPNDVMISKIVPHIRRASVVGPFQGLRQIASGEWIVFRSGRIYPNYLRHVLLSDQFNASFMATVSGVGGSLLRARPAEVAKIKISLPSLAEQRRIAAILDKADALRAKRREAIAKLDQLLQSVFLDMFGDPVTNPKGWPVLTFGDLIKVKSGNGLTAQEMDPDGVFNVYGGNGISGRHSEYMFEDPQIVIGRVGVYCGVVHRTEPKSWVTDNALYVSQVLRPVNARFLQKILSLANFNQYAGRAAQPLVSGSRIYPVQTIFPPRTLQDEYERRVRLVSDQEARVRGHARKLDELFSSIQSRAFAGTL